MLSKIKETASKFIALDWLFHACVTVPTITALSYFGFIASDVYISESRFVVRSPNKPEATGFGFLLKTVGVSNAGEEILVANNYLSSRDALIELNKNGEVEKSYSSSAISFLNRYNSFGWQNSFEDLYEYFGGKVEIQYDSSTSITSLRVRAYNAADAKRFNEALLRQAEGLVNRLNNRARTDLVTTASEEVERARADARRASMALSEFRNRAGVIDPEKQSAIKLQMISKLQDELIASRLQLNQIQVLAPASSEIHALKSRITGLESSIASEMSRVAGGKNSLSNSAVEYQRLILENQFADKKLGLALSSFEDARVDAQRKQAYVSRIVQPGLPDEAEEPHRLRSIMATIAMGLIVWGILSLLISSVRDHVE